MFNMADEIKWTKALTCELIFNYEMNPILYNPCHPECLNRVKKADAFESVLNALKPLEQNITLDAIKKKLHTLRTQFCKEFRDAEKSKKSGAGIEDVYEPKLWCYDQLFFLKTYCKTRTSVSSIEENENENQIPRPVSRYSGEIEQDDSSFANAFTPKRKRTTSNAGKFDKVAELLQKKIESKSSYSWLGKQVIFEIDSIQNDAIKRKASWAIQKILHESVEEDLALQKSVSSSAESTSTHSGSWQSYPAKYKNSSRAQVYNVELIRPPSSNSDAARSPFTPDLLEQSMVGLFEDEELV